MGSRPAQNPVDQGLSPSSGRQRELNRQEGSVILLYAAPDRGLYESHTAHRSHESVVSADRQRRPMFSTSLRGLDDARKVEAERGGFVWASQQCPRDQTPGSTGHAGHHSSIAPVSKAHNSAGGRACDALPTCPSVNTVCSRRMELTSLGEENGITPAHGYV